MSWRWKLIYRDGTEFTDLDGEPWEAPHLGLLITVQPGHDPPIYVNADVVFYRDDLGSWEQCGSDGMRDHLTLDAHLISAVRWTMWIPKPDFEKAWIVAREEVAARG